MPDASLQRKLRNWQMLLLDLTRANRLLYFKPERGSSVPITEPASAELFQLLVTQGKQLKFPAVDERALFEEEENETAEPAPPAGVEASAGAAAASPAEASTEPAPRSRNNTLASSLSETRLTRALYNLRARARSAAEEQGVNILFVAFGLLHWIDAETNDDVPAPIMLVPVRLEKERGREAYALELLEDDLLLNPTLAYKLKIEFDLRLPDLPEDIEETGLAAYFDQLRGLIAGRSAGTAWTLTDEAILGVFSFQKINLYQDIAAHEDQYAAHPIIVALAGSAPLPPPPPALLATELDDRVPPSNSFQVIDADASQQEAIEAAKAGVSFVMQGPPGTGKSQTITNIIAEMLAAGKRVLFVSQKMAALEVVQHRLNRPVLAISLGSHHARQARSGQGVDRLARRARGVCEARIPDGAARTGRNAPSTECLRESLTRAALCPAAIGV
jgi:hypothetical protein